MYIILQEVPEFKINPLCNYLHILAIKLNESLGNFQMAFFSLNSTYDYYV